MLGKECFFEPLLEDREPTVVPAAIARRRRVQTVRVAPLRACACTAFREPPEALLPLDSPTLDCEHYEAIPTKQLASTATAATATARRSIHSLHFA